MNTGVYKIINKITNKIYIGSCSSIHGFNGRWKEHIRTLKENCHSNEHLQKSWNKYGEKFFLFEVLETCEPNKCLEREQYYLDVLNPQYNIYKIAGSPFGRIVSKKTREKISKTLSGRIPSMKTRKKISLYHKGKPKTEKHKRLVREILWGENGVLRSRKGTRFLGNFKFLNIKTGQETICGKFELADKFNIDRSFVCKMTNNKIKQCKGWICKGKE